MRIEIRRRNVFIVFSIEIVSFFLRRPLIDFVGFHTIIRVRLTERRRRNELTISYVNDPVPKEPREASFVFVTKFAYRRRPFIFYARFYSAFIAPLEFYYENRRRPNVRYPTFRNRIRVQMCMGGVYGTRPGGGTFRVKLVVKYRRELTAKRVREKTKQ